MSNTVESLLDLDSLLSAEDLQLRTMVREFGELRLRPPLKGATVGTAPRPAQ